MNHQINSAIAGHEEFKIAGETLALHLGLCLESVAYDLDFETRPFEKEFADFARRKGWILNGYEDWNRVVKFHRPKARERELSSNPQHACLALDSW